MPETPSRSTTTPPPDVPASQLSRDQLLARNESLELANQLRSRFVSTISHELQTPLVAISGLTDILQTEWLDLPDESRRDYVSAISRQAGRLQSLVQDLLTTTGIQAGTIRANRRPVPLAATALQVRHDRGIGFTLRCAGDLRVLADPDHVQQIIAKLIVNADRYGAPPISLEARLDGDDVVFSVCDHGPGVPPSFIPQMFDLFTQSPDHVDRTEGSTGLGLTIVKGLLDANGGSITYREGAGGGARFELRLPKA